MAVKDEGETHAHENCPACDWGLNQKPPARSTALHSSSDSSKHCSYEWLMHLVNCLHSRMQTAWVFASSSQAPGTHELVGDWKKSSTRWRGRVPSISYWCLLCSCACHRNAAQATHFSAIPTSMKSLKWLHLPQMAWWASSTKDVAQRPHGQLYSPEVPDPLWS